MDVSQHRGEGGDGPDAVATAQGVFGFFAGTSEVQGCDHTEDRAFGWAFF